jgi:hypothetical protein
VADIGDDLVDLAFIATVVTTTKRGTFDTIFDDCTFGLSLGPARHDALLVVDAGTILYEQR